MARQGRRTEPLETLHGVLTEYSAIEALLSEGEVKGRAWVLERAHQGAFAQLTPTDNDIFELHRVMFGHFLAWAGATRLEDRGPGGKVPVSYYQVRIELRSFTDDLCAWVGAMTALDIDALGAVIADAHHRFQWIHPFHDTNGRTGRVLDHYLLWVTFDLAGSMLVTSPTIEYFPTEAHENEYYEGLRQADDGHPYRLRAYYVDRLLAAFNAM